LTEVDLEDVGMFLIQLTNRDFLQSKPDNVDELDNCHDAIAFSLCNQIIAEPLSFHIKLYIKLLANLRVSIDDFTKLKDLKALYQQMKDCVKDKVYLKSLEKFGQKIEAYIEAYLEQNPNQEEAKEPPAGEGSVAAETEPAQDNPNNATAANATAANATKLFRKRALFSQTANTLLEADIDPSTPPPPSTIKELVEKKDTSKKNAVSESDDDDLFATPNRSATKIKPRQGEIEITRIDESPLDDGTEEIVSGNIQVAKKLNLLDSEDTDSESDEAGPTTSTQIESRRSSKRLINTSTTTSTEEEEESIRGKRNSKGGKKKSMEPSKPQRKSRRIDSSTDTTSASSSEEIKTKRSAKKRSRRLVDSPRL